MLQPLGGADRSFQEVRNEVLELVGGNDTNAVIVLENENSCDSQDLAPHIEAEEAPVETTENQGAEQWVEDTHTSEPPTQDSKRKSIYDLLKTMTDVKQEINHWAQVTKKENIKNRLHRIVPKVAESENIAMDMAAYIHKLKRTIEVEKAKNKHLEKCLEVQVTSFQQSTKEAAKVLSEGLLKELKGILENTKEPQPTTTKQDLLPPRAQRDSQRPNKPPSRKEVTSQAKGPPPARRQMVNQEQDQPPPHRQEVLPAPERTAPPQRQELLPAPEVNASPRRQDVSPEQEESANTECQENQFSEQPENEQRAQTQDLQNTEVTAGTQENNTPGANQNPEDIASTSQSQEEQKGQNWQTVKKGRRTRKGARTLVVQSKKLETGQSILENVQRLDLPVLLPIKYIKEGKSTLEITCESSEDAEQVMEALRKCPKFQRNAKVEPKGPPTLKVTIERVPVQCCSDIVGKKLKQSLPLCQIRQKELKLASRKESPGWATWTVTLPLKDARTLLALKKLHFGFSPSRVFIEKTIRCYKCQGLGHLVDICPNETICAVCSGRHPAKGCKNTPHCINCWSANYKNGTQLNPYHTAWDTFCPTFRAYRAKVQG